MPGGREERCGHQSLVSQFAGREVTKQYLAAVAGTPVLSEGTVEERIGRNPHQRQKMSVVAGTAGKPAVTRYRVLGSHAGSALVYCDLMTGRTHQIRRSPPPPRPPAPRRCDLRPGATRRWGEPYDAPRVASRVPPPGYRDQLRFEAPGPAGLRPVGRGDRRTGSPPPCHLMVDHLYVHIPFCHRICPYCSFFKHTPGSTQNRAFVDAVLAELDHRVAEEPVAPRTVYLGGGTPTLLSEYHLGALLGGLAQRIDTARLKEWTIEANPATFGRTKAQLMKTTA